jgi:hypothetical protein
VGPSLKKAILREHGKENYPAMGAVHLSKEVAVIYCWRILRGFNKYCREATGQTEIRQLCSLQMSPVSALALFSSETDRS